MAGFDFDAARKAGYSDDEILDFVSKGDSGVGVKIDVDGARKAGYTSRDIIDHLKDAGVAPKDTSYGSALRHGASEGLRGLGQTLETLGATDLGPSVKKLGADIAPKNYQPATDQVMNPQPGDTTVNPGKYVQPAAKLAMKMPGSPAVQALGAAARWLVPDKEYGVRELPRAAVEGAPPMAMDVGAGAAGSLAGGPVGGFLAATGSYASRNAGDRIQARAANSGRTEPSAMDKILGTGVATAEGALNAVPAGRIAAPGRVAGTGLRGVGEALANVGTTGATGAGAGYGSSLLEQAGTTAGTDQGLTVDPKQALGSAIQSGATATALASPRAIRRDIPEAIRYREMGSDLLREGSARFANRLEDRADGDSLLNVHTAGRSFIEAQHDVMSELRAARKLVDLSTEGENAVSRAERGLPLLPKDIRGLDRELAGQEGGGNLSSLVKEATASQLLSEQGHVNTRSGVFAGGLAAKMRDFARNRPGFAIALTGMTGGATIPAYLALRAAASKYGLGTHSPAETFVSKFKDDTVPRIPPEVLPPQRNLSEGPWGPRPPETVPSVPLPPQAPQPAFGALHKPPPGFDMLLRAGVTSINRDQRQADKAQTIADRTRKQDESAGNKAGKGFARDLQTMFEKEPPQPARKASPNDPVEAALKDIAELKLRDTMNKPAPPPAPAAPPNTATAENPVEKALRSIANIKKSEPDGLLDTVARVARATNRVKSPDQQAATPKRERATRMPSEKEQSVSEGRQPGASEGQSRQAPRSQEPPPVIEEIPVPNHLIHTEIDGRDKAIAAQAAHEFQQSTRKPSHIVRRYEESAAMRQARIRDRLMAISKDERFPSEDMPLMEALDTLRTTRTREDLHAHIEDVASEQPPLVGALLRAYFSPKWAKSVWRPTQK